MDTFKVQAAVDNLRRVLMEQSPDDNPLVEICVSPKVFDDAIFSFYHQQHLNTSPTNIHQFQIAGIRFSPKYKDK